MKLGLVLHTCDNYQFLWDGWYHYFNKHWNYDIPIYFVNEEIDVRYKGMNQVCTGKGEWSDRLVTALKIIPCDTIMYMQEDFWAVKPVENLNQLLFYFRKMNMDCLRIHDSLLNKNFYTVKKTGFDNLYKFDENSNYLLSHQFSIWNKEFFLSCLEPNENPWVNEKRGTKRLQGKPNNIYGYNKSWYKAVCRKGKFTEKGLLMEKQRKDEV